MATDALTHKKGPVTDDLGSELDSLVAHEVEIEDAAEVLASLFGVSPRRPRSERTSARAQRSHGSGR